ncbi:MAG: flippase [Cytophagales bacterium]|nr:flippase [Cytophagales bacterium]
MALSAVTKNIAWLGLDRMVRMGLGLIINLWIARYLGPGDFGKLNYCLSLVSIFGVLANLGLDSLIVRDLVNHKEERDKILSTALNLRLLAACASLLLLLWYVNLFEDDRAKTAFIVVFSLSFFFQSFDVFDYFYQSQLQSKYVVWCKNTAFLLSTLVKVGVVLLNLGFESLAWAYLSEFALSAVLLSFTYKRTEGRWIPITCSPQSITYMIKEGWPLLFAGLVTTVYMRMDQIMLDRMYSSQEVGIYAAASRLSEIWYFIPIVVCNSLFPSVLESRKDDIIKYKQQLRALYLFLNGLSYSIALPVALMSPFIIKLLYGAEYSMSSTVLSIHIWSGLFVFLGVASSQYLIAENLTGLAFLRTLIGALLNLFLNGILIPKWGAAGAAWASLASYALSTFGIVFTKSGRQHTYLMLSSLNPLAVYHHFIHLYYAKIKKVDSAHS